MTILFPVFVILIFFAGNILALIGMDATTSKEASVFLIASIPAVFGFIQFDSAKYFMNGLARPEITFYVLALCIPLHLVWCYLFVIYLNMGCFGLGIAFSITELL